MIPKKHKERRDADQDGREITPQAVRKHASGAKAISAAQRRNARAKGVRERYKATKKRFWGTLESRARLG
ncbi:hypothetical protein HPP92_006867 [Vanilla planifolia]|uniref:Uncharacterized protein n=1 Tax=Vanilla planifolia TaxID=51239 RepID=A0A835RJ83_VANPL|nr:hypothetical protein HPP92_007106 [Vanilla planifolia]KAG0490004.1 hypothetical protein HPP92_006867 [Vanilla planifolia]